ncbi:MAG TPA: glycosyltransferase [Flavobacteriales bacterium]|nr:glycosyltransferase [Flavobacteriales bacterium]
MPRVSILLPFHNAATTLDAAIASIATQTFLDWELLLIDNACTDKGTAIAHDRATRDARIRVMQEPVVGIAHALNTGLREARATLIARMDADDIALPERFERQVAYLDQHPEVGVLGTRTRFRSTVDLNEGMAAFVKWQNTIISPKDHYVKRFVDAPLAHPTVMFRSELVDRHGGYDAGPLPEDHELWLRWMHYGVRFAKLPQELLIWRDHPQRLSRSHSNYAVEAFFSTKVKWLALWLERILNGRPVIVAGTSALCRGRAAQLSAHGIPIHGYTDVKRHVVPGYPFVPHDELPGPGQAFIVSFISQRGTGDRIAAYLVSRGLVEGEDFILAA